MSPGVAASGGGFAPNAYNSKMIRLVNFPKPMLAKKLERLAKGVVQEKVAAADSASAEVRAYDLRTRVSVTFATDLAAKNFYEITKGGISIDIDGEDTLVYTKKDRSLESRITQKAVGELWKMCGDAFKDSDQWTREHEIGSKIGRAHV